MRLVPRVVVLLSLALAPGLGVASGATVPATTVKVKLIEYKLIPTPKVVRAGKVTFVVHNAGRIGHEFVILKTAIPAAKLPMNGMVAQEPGRLARIPGFPPGQTKTLTLTLKPGHYVLLCNMPIHYKAGQYSDFVVR